MLTEKLQPIVREQLALIFQERDTAAQSERSTIYSDMAQRGILQSSMTIQQVTGIYVRELKIRGEIALQQVFRVLAAAGVEPSSDFGPSLKAFATDVITEQRTHLRGLLGGFSFGGVGGAFGMNLDRDLDEARDFAVRKASSDIDIYVIQVRAVADEARRAGATHVTVHGSVGNLQTGAFSRATFSGQIDAQHRQEISSALARFEELLTSQSSCGVANKSELAELIAESKAEIAKDKPNVTRLRSLLSGIGSLTSYVGALRPAYENLRDAAIWIGGLF